MKAGRTRLHRIAPPSARMEAVDHDLRAAGEEHAHERVADRVDVERGQHLHQPLFAAAERDQAALRLVPLAPAVEVTIGEHAAFRLARRAGGIEERALGLLAAPSGGLAAWARQLFSLRGSDAQARALCGSREPRT